MSTDPNAEEFKERLQKANSMEEMKQIVEDDFIRQSISGVAGYVDENHEPVEKNPMTHPYSFDSFLIHEDIGGIDLDKVRVESIWSDRIKGRDYEKFERMSKAHFETSHPNWEELNPKKTEDFLSDYLDQNLKIIRVMKCCNKSTGFPLYRFDVIDKDKLED